MTRELALKIVLGVVGVVFLALGYPMVLFFREEPALAMMLSLYVTLGVFLLLASVLVAGGWVDDLRPTLGQVLPRMGHPNLGGDSKEAVSLRLMPTFATMRPSQRWGTRCLRSSYGWRWMRKV